MATTTNYVTANLPGQRYYELLASGPIIETALGLLPNTLPYAVRIVGSRFSTIGNVSRHHIAIELLGANFFETVLSYTSSWPALLHKRFTLSYEPATDVDAQTIQSYGGLTSTPPYLIKVKPVLKVEGVTVSTGNAVGMANDITFQMSFVRPQGVVEDIVINTLTAGSDFAIGLDAGSSTGRVVKGRTEKLEMAVAGGQIGDPVIGEYLNLMPQSYLEELSSSRKLISKTMKLVDTNQSVELMVGVNLMVSYLFNVPRRVEIGGIFIDVDRNFSIPFDMAGNHAKMRRFQILIGMTSSALEHTVFQKIIGADAVSAIKALQVASTQGIPIHNVNAGNLQEKLTLLQLSSSVEGDIADAVNAGLEVKVSERNIQLNNWNGVGYIILNPTTGEGAYRISGGLSGGSLTEVAQRLQEQISSGQMTLEEAKQHILTIKEKIFFNPPVMCPKKRGFSADHKGIDYACPNWTPVEAVAAGKVTRAGFSDGGDGFRGYGNVVYMDHGAGIETRYAHNCELKVSLNQQFDTGEIIVMSGNTGDVQTGRPSRPVPRDYPRCSNDNHFQNGAHVHFEIRLNGQAVDPESFNMPQF